MELNNLKITTDCGKEFELTNLVTVSNGNLNSNINYTYTIYRAPTQEYIQKKSFYNPNMNHTSVNYQIIPESALQNFISASSK